MFVGLTTLLTVGGASVAAFGMLRSRELTGEWIGSGLANDILAMIAIGLLTFAFGFLLLVSAVIASLGDKFGVWNALRRPILTGSHPVARVGRGILLLQRLRDGVVFVLVVGVVGFTAFHDRLVAAILGGTAVLIAVLFLRLRDREETHPGIESIDRETAPEPIEPE